MPQPPEIRVLHLLDVLNGVHSHNLDVSTYRMLAPHEAPYQWMATSTAVGLLLAALQAKHNPSFTTSKKDVRHMVVLSAHSVIVGAPILYALAVLLGGDTWSPETAAWAVMQSAFTFAPFVHACRGVRAALAELTDADCWGDHPEASFPALLSLLGAWLFSAATLLDWQVAWQKWPAPSIVGCLMGAALGHMICFLLQEPSSGFLRCCFPVCCGRYRQFHAE